MKNVIVIGAGPAGLTAAFELLKHEGTAYSVLVLEESGEIGGISRTIQVRGNRMDIGGHRFFSKNDRVMQWWRERLPLQGAPALDDRLLARDVALDLGGPDPEKQDRVMLVRTRVSRIFSLQRFFDYPISLKMRTIRNLGWIRTVHAGCSYLCALVWKKEETSLENFYINRFGKVLYKLFFEKYTEKIWGRHPSAISASWGTQRVRGLSVRAVLRDMLRKATGARSEPVETSLIEQFWYPKLGPGQLWETVAREIADMGGAIRTHHRVVGLSGRDGVLSEVVCDTPDGRVTLQGDHIFSSMPLRDLVGGMKGLDMPAPVARIAAGLPYRDFVTVGLLVQNLEIRNTTQMRTLGGLVPDCWIYVQEPGVRLGRIQIFNNWSPYLTKDPVDTVWIGLEYFCDEHDDLWRLSDKEMVDFAIGETASIGIIRPDAVKDTHVARVRKAYPAYFDTYDEIEELESWLNTVGNLYCIGRNGQHRYNNMDHSMLTAFEAVELLLKGSPSKESLWRVNTEKTYHEEKSE